MARPTDATAASSREVIRLRNRVAELQREVRNSGFESLRAQEQERQWTACEVHDRIAQTLASVFQQLQTLELLTRADPRARQVAIRGSRLCREAIREARNIMNDLHPPILDEFGLAPLIDEELRHLQEDLGCAVRQRTDYEERPAMDVEVAVYRIFHEALVNVRKHAPGCRNISVWLSSRDRVVRLDVADDGPGFDAEAAAQTGRVGGLMSMRRRAEMVGGTCGVTSEVHKGTTIRASVPFCSSESTDGTGQ